MDLNDVPVPEKQKDIPAHTDRPNVRYNPAPLNANKDILEVITKLNGKEVNAWKYTPSITAGTGKQIQCVVKLETVIGLKPEIAEVL